MLHFLRERELEQDSIQLKCLHFTIQNKVICCPAHNGWQTQRNSHSKQVLNTHLIFVKTERNVDERKSSRHVLQGAGTARGVQDLNLECREIEPFESEPNLSNSVQLISTTSLLATRTPMSEFHRWPHPTCASPSPSPPRALPGRT